MSMLTHHFEYPFHSSATKAAAATGPTKARRGAIKRICLRAMIALLAGGGLAALVALKSAIFFWRFSYS